MKYHNIRQYTYIKIYTPINLLYSSKDHKQEMVLNTSGRINIGLQM